MKILNFMVVAGLVGFTGIAARADFIAVDVPQTTTGNQGSPGYLLGEDFTVPAAGITVTNLAAFDPSAGGQAGDNIPLGTGPYDSIPVGIYSVDDPNHPLLMSTPGINQGNSHFYSSTSAFRVLNSFSPVFLGPGTYRVVSTNYVNEDEYNSSGTTGTIVSYGALGSGDPGGTVITFPADSGNGFNNFPGDASPTLSYPTGGDGGPINRYAAGTFTFVAAPEPATLSLLAIAGLGLLARRSRAIR